MNIPTEIRFADRKLKDSFYMLKDGSDQERKLFKSINNAIIGIKENAFYGIQIQKKLIPKEYVQKYKIENLWKVNLLQGWRLLYSVLEEEIVVVSIILEWLSHKEYEKRFKF